MDKIYISKCDEEKLFDWRDEHKNLVRNYKASTKKVKYVLNYEAKNPIIITVIDSGKDRVDFTITQQGKRLDSFRYDRYTWGVSESWNAIKETEEERTVRIGARQEAISIHCSTQALLNNRRIAERNSEQEIRWSVAKTTGKTEIKDTAKKKSKRNNIIKISDALYTPVEAYAKSFHNYTKPTREISVRGHYRHYKSGKTIWIEEYKKNSGKSKKSRHKEYKLDL